MQGLNFFLEIHYMVRISTKTMSNVNCDVIGATRLGETSRDYREIWLLLLYMVRISTKTMSNVNCDVIGATRLHENWRDFTRLSRDLDFITAYGQNKHYDDV